VVQERKSGVQMSGEKRKSHRQTLKYPAKIDIGNGEGPMNCLLTDVSATGARVAVEFPDQVPEYFSLLLAPEHSVMRRCKVVWREGSAIGAEFVKASDFKAATRKAVNDGKSAA
jgi:hypothetical protein